MIEIEVKEPSLQEAWQTLAVEMRRRGSPSFTILAQEGAMETLSGDQLPARLVVLIGDPE